MLAEGDKRRVMQNIKAHSHEKKVIVLLVLGLLLVVVVATALGAVTVPLNKTVEIILKDLGVVKFEQAPFSASQEAIIFFVRFPRVVVAVLVGAALALAGAVMQGMFRNPLADPGIIGISSGASLGAVLAIAWGLTAKSLYFMPLLATAGAFMAALVIYGLSARGGKFSVLTLVLAGIAVSTFIGALTSLTLTFLNEYQVREYLFWSVGSLSGRRWEHVRLVALPVLISMLMLMLFARDLNVLLLGEEEAQSVGLNPAKTRKWLLFFASVTTALAVSVSGHIAFVGLIVPHVMRLLVGPDHRVLLPASALAGALFLVICDLVARIVVMPLEIEVGIVTSLLGAPYFLFLLYRAKKEGVSL